MSLGTTLLHLRMDLRSMVHRVQRTRMVPILYRRHAKLSHPIQTRAPPRRMPRPTQVQKLLQLTTLRRRLGHKATLSQPRNCEDSRVCESFSRMRKTKNPHYAYDRIVAHDFSRADPEYKVRWTNRPSNEDSWEPRWNLPFNAVNAYHRRQGLEALEFYKDPGDQ